MGPGAGDTWGQQGSTRRRFLAGAGLAAGAALVGGGLAVRRLPLDDWYGEVTGGDEFGAGTVALSTTTVHWPKLMSRTIDGPVTYAIVWPPGTRPGDPFWSPVTQLTTVLPEPVAGGFSSGKHGGEHRRKTAPAQVEFIERALGE